VVSTNQAAVTLWQSLGFDIIGKIPEAYRHPEKGLVGVYVMYKRV
jgi:ribosomal protein S18 acetylase RimI-like enzyme